MTSPASEGAEGPAPAGGEVELAIQMIPAPGWHGYWLNPGDAGLPMEVKWQLPPRFAAGPLRHSAALDAVATHWAGGQSLAVAARARELAKELGVERMRVKA